MWRPTPNQSSFKQLPPKLDPPKRTSVAFGKKRPPRTNTVAQEGRATVISYSVFSVCTRSAVIGSRSPSATPSDRETASVNPSNVRRRGTSAPVWSARAGAAVRRTPEDRSARRVMAATESGPTINDCWEARPGPKYRETRRRRRWRRRSARPGHRFFARTRRAGRGSIRRNRGPRRPASIPP